LLLHKNHARCGTQNQARCGTQNHARCGTQNQARCGTQNQARCGTHVSELFANIGLRSLFFECVRQSHQTPPLSEPDSFSFTFLVQQAHPVGDGAAFRVDRTAKMSRKEAQTPAASVPVTPAARSQVPCPKKKMLEARCGSSVSAFAFDALCVMKDAETLDTECWTMTGCRSRGTGEWRLDFLYHTEQWTDSERQHKPGTTTDDRRQV
jgi:hypothetical protein